MVKRMNRRKRMIRGAAIFVVLAAVAVIVRAIIRKRRARISYGPMHERDRQRFDYLSSKIWQCDVKCKNMLRFERAPFFHLCDILRDRKLLKPTIHLDVEQQVAMFLHTIGHNLRNRVVATNFCRSFGTISIYFRRVLHAIGQLRNDYIRPPSLEIPTKIAGNHRFDPYFKDCIGAIDGTHVRASVTKDVEASFRGRKGFTTQNVMAAVDFDLRFTYVLAGWEGTAHDATVLADALARERGLQVPQEMDSIDLTDASANTCGSGQAVWTNSMTTMMLGFLANLVADGKRTSTGFKMTHHNQCATALNEHFKLAITGGQVYNHLKKWRKIWGRLVTLKNLSGALWDEDTCTIRLSDDHYAGHCKDHKSDVTFLNTPIEHYRAMETIFLQKTATGKNARSGNDDLSIEIEDDDNGEVNMSPNVGESSNPKEPAKKKAKVVKNQDDPLMTTLQDGFKLVAAALVKSGGDDDTIPDDLWEVVSGTIGFAERYLAHYYAHLVDNPMIARAFMSLSESNRLIWVGRYVTKNFA